MSQKILVTGASGFVGAHLAAGLAASGYEIIAAAGRNTVAPEVRRAASAVIELPLEEPQLLRRIDPYRPDIVVHAAALASTVACEEDPGLAYAVNAEATRRLVSHCAASARPPLLIYISTDLVFEAEPAPPGGFKESAPPQPLSVYGKSKVAGEQEVLRYAGSKTVLRICLTYGRKIGAKTGFLGWLLGALRSGQEVTLFSDEWRTPVHAGDITIAVARIGERLSPGRSGPALPAGFPELLHLGGAERLSRVDMGLAAAELLGCPPSLIQPATRYANPSGVPRAPDASLSCALIEDVLSLSPRGFRTGLQQVLAESCA